MIAFERQSWAHDVLRLVLLTALSVIMMACGRAPDEPLPQASAQTAESWSVPPRRVEISVDAQRALGLVVEPLAATTVRPEIRGYGRILDPGPLAALVGELDTAKSALAASQQERVRVRQLQREDNASERAVEAAEATTVRDRWVTQAARDRIALSWGQAIAGRTDLPAFVEALIRQRIHIVRVDLARSEALPDFNQPARLAGVGDESQSMRAEWIGLAPATDPQMQGRGVLYVTHAEPIGLAIGQAVTAFLPTGGDVLTGVTVPRNALVRYQALPWIYIQTSETTFDRMALSNMHPLPDSWLVPSGLTAGSRVVTKGAQVLLSEELKGNVRLGD